MPLASLLSYNLRAQSYWPELFMLLSIALFANGSLLVIFSLSFFPWSWLITVISLILFHQILKAPPYIPIFVELQIITLTYFLFFTDNKSVRLIWKFIPAIVFFSYIRLYFASDEVSATMLSVLSSSSSVVSRATTVVLPVALEAVVVGLVNGGLVTGEWFLLVCCGGSHVVRIGVGTALLWMSFGCLVGCVYLVKARMRADQLRENYAAVARNNNGNV